VRTRPLCESSAGRGTGAAGTSRVIGVVLALAGLAGATTTVELLISRGQSLVIDADGIRRKRLQGWSLDWSQIEAVSLTVGESILVRARAGRRCPRR
jgi:hypothetical protein